MSMEFPSVYMQQGRFLKLARALKKSQKLSAQKSKPSGGFLLLKPILLKIW